MPEPPSELDELSEEVAELQGLVQFLYEEVVRLSMVVDKLLDELPQRPQPGQSAQQRLFEV